MEYIEIDGRKFETNGIYNYKNRGISVGQLHYDLPTINIWRGAALEAGEEEIIFDAANLVGGGRLVNLGDLRGGSAILMAQGLKYYQLPGYVHTVDFYSQTEKENSEANMVKAGVKDLITIHHCRTDEAIKNISPEISFLFIDADHAYDGVKADWELYSPHVKEDGLIAFHDTNQTGINKVLEELVVSDWKLEHWVNRIKVFRRR